MSIIILHCCQNDYFWRKYKLNYKVKLYMICVELSEHSI